METTAEIAAIKVHIDNIKRDVERLETYIATVDKELDIYKIDLQEAISQCRGITSQVAEISSELKNIDETVTTVKAGVTTCEKERKETIWKFVKENPEKSVKITLLVSVIIFLISLKNFDVITMFLKLIGVK